jgi:hypothetical protein
MRVGAWLSSRGREDLSHANRSPTPGLPDLDWAINISPIANNMSQQPENSKDSWDKLGAITPLILGLIVTGGAALFGAIHNTKQDKLAEISALEKFQGKLNSTDPLEREFGYSAFAALGYEEIALRLIRLRKDRPAEDVVNAIKKSNSSLAAQADATLKELREVRAPGGQTVKLTTESDGTVNFAEGWDEKNIVPVEIRQLRGIPGAAESGKIRFYREAAADLQAAFAEIEKRQLLSLIKSWDGAYRPRTVLRSSQVSNHAWGIAFDINVESNPYGQTPPPAHEKGSVVELVPIFAAHHFEWGGSYQKPEGNHFQWIPPERRE